MAVTVAPDGTRTQTGGIGLITNGVVSPALFTVNGQSGAVYSIGLFLDSPTLTRVGGIETLTLSALTSSPNPAGVLDVTGLQVLTIGATLTIPNAAPPGTYTGNSISVVVNYN